MLQKWFRSLNFSQDALRLLGAWSLMAFSYFGIQGVLLNLYLLRIGFGVETLGLLIASGQFVWGLMALPAGMAGQRWGLRPAIIVGFALTILGLALILVAEAFPPAWHVPWVFGGWIVVWVGAAFNSVNGGPFMMLAAPPAQRRQAFAAQSGVTAFAGFVGGIVAGILPGLVAGWMGATLEDPAPYRVVLWTAPLLYLVGIWILAGAQPLRAPKLAPGDHVAAAPWALFLYLGLVIFFQTAGEGSARAFFNVYLDTGLALEPAQIGTIMGIAQVLPVLASLTTPFVLQRWGTARTMVLSSLGVGVAFVVMAAVRHWGIAGLSFATIISMITVNGTARNVFTQELVMGHWRTTASAVQTIGMALGWAMMAALGGFLIQATGFAGLFLTSAALAAAGSVLLLLGERSPQRAARPAQADLVPKP